MPFISTLYFRTAIVLLITGIVIGIHMSIQGDHSVMGAHAHLNLLGWVTSSLFAIYYALHPAKAVGRLPFVQYAVYMIGLAVMIPSLYVMLKGNPGAEPLVATGSLITFAGVLMFGWVVFAPAPKVTSGMHLQPAE